MVGCRGRWRARRGAAPAGGLHAASQSRGTDLLSCHLVGGGSADASPGSQAGRAQHRPRWATKAVPAHRAEHCYAHSDEVSRPGERSLRRQRQATAADGAAPSSTAMGGRVSFCCAINHVCAGEKGGALARALRLDFQVTAIGCAPRAHTDQTQHAQLKESSAPAFFGRAEPGEQRRGGDVTRIRLRGRGEDVGDEMPSVMARYRTHH